MTVAEALTAAARRLADAGVPDPARDARRLVAHALGLAPERLTLVADQPFDAGPALEAAIERRVARQPVAQIVGWREFWGRRFAVTARRTRPAARDRDAGRGGPGPALRAGARPRHRHRLHPPDADGRAAGRGGDRDRHLGRGAQVAGRNAAALGLDPRLVVADWWQGIGGGWDLIVSNPPYIAAHEMATLAPELGWEPAVALTPGGDGLDAYRRIAAGARERLLPGGRILLEIGPTQAAAVGGLLTAAGLGDVTVARDLDGRERVVIARRSPT